MSNQPLFSVSGSGLIIRPEAFDLLVAYARYYVSSSHSAMDQYLKEANADPDSSALVAAKREIARAENAVTQLEELRQQAGTIYRWNFVQLAEVFRRARHILELDRIEYMYATRVVLECLMEVLANENPKFNKEKFVDYINEVSTARSEDMS